MEWVLQKGGDGVWYVASQQRERLVCGGRRDANTGFGNGVMAVVYDR